MDDVPFRRLDETLLLPYVVENMIPSAPQFQRVFRQPEERQQDIFLVIARGGKARPGRDIRRTGQVHPLRSIQSVAEVPVNGKIPLS